MLELKILVKNHSAAADFQQIAAIYFYFTFIVNIYEIDQIIVRKK